MRRTGRLGASIKMLLSDEGQTEMVSGRRRPLDFRVYRTKKKVLRGAIGDHRAKRHIGRSELQDFFSLKNGRLCICIYRNV